jgi:hypothetical protein
MLHGRGRDNGDRYGPKGTMKGKVALFQGQNIFSFPQDDSGILRGKWNRCEILNFFLQSFYIFFTVQNSIMKMKAVRSG